MTSLNFNTVFHFCNNINVGVSPVIVDMKNITFIEPFGVIYLGIFIDHWRNKGVGFSLQNTKPKIRSYLATQSFYKRLNFTSEYIKKYGSQTNRTSLNDIIIDLSDSDDPDDLSYNLRQRFVDNGVKANINSICEAAIPEVVDNFIQHSEKKYAFLMAQHYPSKKMLSIAMGDGGIGIKNSLLKKEQYSFLESQPDHKAIEHAFKLLVTSKNEGGTGLTLLKDTIEENKGYLYYTSNKGYLIIKNGRTQLGSLPFKLEGVQMEFGFPETG